MGFMCIFFILFIVGLVFGAYVMLTWITSVKKGQQADFSRIADRLLVRPNAARTVQEKTSAGNEPEKPADNIPAEQEKDTFEPEAAEEQDSVSTEQD